MTPESTFLKRVNGQNKVAVFVVVGIVTVVGVGVWTVGDDRATYIVDVRVLAGNAWSGWIAYGTPCPSTADGGMPLSGKGDTARTFTFRANTLDSKGAYLQIKTYRNLFSIVIVNLRRQGYGVIDGGSWSGSYGVNRGGACSTDG